MGHGFGEIDMTAKYGDGLPKADGVWDFTPSVKNYGTIEPPANSGDQYSVKIFQWILEVLFWCLDMFFGCRREGK